MSGPCKKPELARVSCRPGDVGRTASLHGDGGRGRRAPADPEGSQSVKDEELVPSEVWSFPFNMAILAPEQRRKDQ